MKALIHAATWTRLKQEYAKCKKTDTKDHILYDSFYMKCVEKANLYKEKVN